MLVPVTQLGPPLTIDASPLDLIARWPDDRPLCALVSGRYDDRWARWSLLGQPGQGHTDPDPRSVDWGWFDAVHRDDRPWLGYLGYDASRVLEPVPDRATTDHPCDWPAACFHRLDGYLLHDARTNHWHAGGGWADAPDWLRDATPRPPRNPRFTCGELASWWSRDEYLQRARRALEYIAAGDVFQVNLTHRLTADARGCPRALFTRWMRDSPAWYGAHLELPGAAHDGRRRVLVSGSPELLLQSAGRHVLTRPIKGTAPTHDDPTALLDSAKDAAELDMIIDLMRNDLGRVCNYGSVRVVQPRAIETHPTVHHGVASVAGEVRADATPAALLGATLPGGSITGAPKVRAMQIIEQLEPGPRGPYCGAIGCVGNGRLNLSMAIRTALLEAAGPDAWTLRYHVGGGIVADSDPAAEHAETLQKAEALRRTLHRHRPSRR